MGRFFHTTCTRCGTALSIDRETLRRRYRHAWHTNYEECRWVREHNWDPPIPDELALWRAKGAS